VIMVYIRSVAAGLAALSLYALQPAGASERNPDAHVHGVSVLNIAIDGKTVKAELVAPGTDIVGFEGTPATPADRKAIERAVEVLRNGNAVLELTKAAQCTFKEVEVESSLIEAAAKANREQGHNHDHDHKREQHAEFEVHYHLKCEAPDQLTNIEVRAFHHFPDMREVELRAISPRGQGAAELTPQSPRFKF